MKPAEQILRSVSFAVLAAMVMAAFQGSGARAEWPERPITIVIPFPAGGTSDLVGRILASALAPKLGQVITVENRSGGVGIDGVKAVTRMPSNGYVLVVTSNSMLINPMINPSATKFAYEPLTEFKPIAYLGASPNIIVTRPGSGIASIADLIDRAKANPGKYTYASPGFGTSSQFVIELLKQQANIDITEASFDGGGPALRAVVSGQTDIASLNIPGILDHIRTGEIKGLAQTGGERWIRLPDVPTMAEAGIPNVIVETSQMLLAPSGTSPMIVSRLALATEEVLRKQDVKSKLLEAGFLVQYESPEELHSRMVREVSDWKATIERTCLRKRLAK